MVANPLVAVVPSNANNMGALGNKACDQLWTTIKDV